MISRVKQLVRARWEAYSRGPFPTLLRVFLGRVFHGGGDSGSGELDIALGVIFILLAMPGVLVSLLLFEKYMVLSFGGFDPFIATIPDEYFFIVLSMVVTGAAAVWRWDALFLDRRDYTNIVPLPISLRRIFLGNLAAILLLAIALIVDVNAASFVLFPVAVVGSQVSLKVLFLQFAAGHAVAVVLASVFSFFAVFATIGLLLAILPYALFRRISLYVRFLIALFFLGLLATDFAVTSFLAQLTRISKSAVTMLPPVWFLGIGQTLWGNGHNPFYAAMARTALLALGISLAVAILSYALSFRRAFIRIPESAEVGPLPRSQFHFLPVKLFDRILLRDPPERACFHFISRTLLRSEAHLQTASAFVAIGLVLAAQSLASVFHPITSVADFLRLPTADLLAIPFVLAFCIIIGIRLAFEVPASLRSNWIFALWIEPNTLETRAIARKILLTFSLVPLVPFCLLSSFLLWDAAIALLHTLIFAACTIAFVEVLLLRFRKIPFTCSYPPFHSHSALIFVAYLFGFVFFTSYLPALELWCLAELWRPILFVPLLAVPFAAVHFYRKQMLDMDKHLIFEENSASSF
ncbi:MAG TPA: hypothetical protein VE077_06855 [Candidatus Methylomirabilis sp.]|nr:hypothetical protein [Candidatus Methylomirabilis sp.]